MRIIFIDCLILLNWEGSTSHFSQVKSVPKWNLLRIGQTCSSMKGMAVEAPRALGSSYSIWEKAVKPQRHRNGALCGSRTQWCSCVTSGFEWQSAASCSQGYAGLKTLHQRFVNTNRAGKKRTMNKKSWRTGMLMIWPHVLQVESNAKIGSISFYICI